MCSAPSNSCHYTKVSLLPGYFYKHFFSPLSERTVAKRRKISSGKINKKDKKYEIRWQQRVSNANSSIKARKALNCQMTCVTRTKNVTHCNP